MNSTELKVQMIRKGKTAEDLYTALGISSTAWFRKVSGKSAFTQGEISSLINELDLDDELLRTIFFSGEVS